MRKLSWVTCALGFLVLSSVWVLWRRLLVEIVTCTCKQLLLLLLRIVVEAVVPLLKF